MDLLTAAIILPFPPSVNTYWRKWKNRMVISDAGREYRHAVVEMVYALLPGVKFGKREVNVSIVFHRKDRREYDVDNFTKGIFDSFTHAGLWNDDKHVIRTIVEKGEIDPSKRGYALIKIKERRNGRRIKAR